VICALAIYFQIWNVENKLETVSSNGQRAKFKYDGDGNRVLSVRPDSRWAQVSWPRSMARP